MTTRIHWHSSITDWRICKDGRDQMFCVGQFVRNRTQLGKWWLGSDSCEGWSLRSCRVWVSLGYHRTVHGLLSIPQTAFLSVVMYWRGFAWKYDPCQCVASGVAWIPWQWGMEMRTFTTGEPDGQISVKMCEKVDQILTHKTRPYPTTTILILTIIMRIGIIHEDIFLTKNRMVFVQGTIF